MKKINWILWLVLNYVTCGIYALYVYYVMTDNNNKIANERGVKTIMGFIPAFLLGIVTCGIFLIVWQYMFVKQQSEIANASGVTLTPTDSPVLLFLLAFVPFYGIYVYAENHNRVVDAN